MFSECSASTVSGLHLMLTQGSRAVCGVMMASSRALSQNCWRPTRPCFRYCIDGRLHSSDMSRGELDVSKCNTVSSSHGFKNLHTPACTQLTHGTDGHRARLYSTVAQWLRTSVARRSEGVRRPVDVFAEAAVQPSSRRVSRARRRETTRGVKGVD